jgi:nucleotide-binding universal stress UspA family protein
LERQLGSKASVDKSTNNSAKGSFEGPFQRILVGLDTSDQSHEIIALVAYLAKTFNSSVIACNVTNMVTSVKGNEMDGFPVSEEERKIHDKLEELIYKQFGDAGKQVRIKTLHGDPAERIVEYAEFCNSDLIVVGSRGQGALKRALLGSVSSSVVAKAKKSVLIVK